MNGRLATMRGLYLTAMILVLVGALNLGLLGLTGMNLLGVLFGGEEWLLRAIYLLIGLAGAFLIYWMVAVDNPTRGASPTTHRTRY